MEYILKLSGSCELDPAIGEKLILQKDYTVTLMGEIRAITDVATDGEEQKKVYRLRVSEIKEING